MAERVVKVRLAAQVSDFEKGMLDAARATRAVGTEAEKLEQKKQAFERLGQGLVLTGSAMTAVTALSVKAALDWESAWAGVTKTVDGNEQQMAELEDGLRSLAQTLPATHQEIAAVAEAAGQLGVARADVVDFTKTMIDLSETTNLSADEAATSIAQLMNVMQTAPEDVDNLGAALVALGNDGASTERDIVQMAQRIAGAGRVVGLTESEVLGFANALASVGIEAEAGGSAISRIMTDIAMSVSNGGEKLDEFAKVAGVSSTEFQKSFKEAPADAIATFVEGLGRIDAQGGDVFQTLTNLGQTDIRVSQALLGMANSGDLLRKSLELGSEAWDENTALAEEAAKRYETTEAKIQIAGNAVRDAAIDFGQVFLPAVSAAADGVAAFSGFMTDLPDPVQGVIAVLTSSVGVMALLGGGALLAVPKLAELKIALETLNISGASAKSSLTSMWQFLTGPYGIAMIAATAAVVGLSVAQEKLRTSTEVFQNVLKNATSSAELFEAGDSAVPFLSRLDEAVSTTKAFKENLDIIANNDFLRGLRGETSQLSAVLTTMGEEMAKLAQTDAPAAARSFRMLSEEMDLSKSEQIDLLNAMKPYRDELVKLADAEGRDVTTKEGQVDMTALLAYAMEDSADAAQTAADAYMEQSEVVADLTADLSELIDQINEANDIAQDAVTANSNWLTALSGISEEVQRQKDAYEESQGTLDGFVLSLDQATEAGAANAASLADVASKAQDAAAAVYENDLTTMNADDATKKYLDTLAAQRQAFIDSAAGAGYNRDEVIKLADQIFATPDAHTTQMLIETAQAKWNLQDLNNAFNSLPKSLNIPVTTTVVGAGTVLKPPGQAMGGPVIGPGAKGVDSELRMLAPGEHVLTAAEVDAAGGHASIESYRASLRSGSWVTPGDRIGSAQVPAQVDQRPIEVKQYFYPKPEHSDSQIARKSAAGINAELRK
ncbi:phage tail tape measure protein [Microbacterium sp. WCS2018Hpa-9]|uniref:phage tail tape measure protein n=1 Tax=Microbacterium sp. WCS2018Hpa-9 TaxID=3073635 RepID=UPI00288C0351|nr:phage tail tape measure protein [Microbacterium sp. WCS2018Hpa-9]